MLVAIAGSAIGVGMTSIPDVSRRAIPMSGAVLIVVSLFWIWPEIAEVSGWTPASGLLFGGFALLWVVDRYLYPVCPSCSHTHDHHSCSTQLHGFGTPLIAAALIHNAFDGWTLMAAQSSEHMTRAISIGLWAHKLPESIAVGVVLKASLRSNSRALAWAALVQMAVFLGAGLESLAAPYIGPQGITALLALGGGTFLYLGVHALHGEWKRRSAHRAVRIG